MSLVLEKVTRISNNETWLSDINLELASGSFNVLLGRTLAGKTSLMRLVAGLDKPSEGRILFNGVDVTGVAVRKRNVSMVYQQFINYPNLTVFENIASPLRLEKQTESEIKDRVLETAKMLHIEPYLDRLPLELSGGQQQRTAMARAVVKNADLILFDEPLVNLDYKLREELRQEMRELFESRNTIAVYATTEPNEALALGGNVVLMHEGSVIQSGPTAKVYHTPASVTCAELFGEPPINMIQGHVNRKNVTFAEHVHFPLNTDLSGLPEGAYQFGIRPNHLSLVPHNDDDLELSVHVELAEISGSETFLHVRNRDIAMVLHLPGVHDYNVDQKISIYVPTHKLYVFDQSRRLVQAARRI
ncbi:ABC transporter ATP-binding protein [Veronia nyctiphanis]|uniref:ABC transporter ATP-binding protein n=1 Tax=Veronia nyctiphanis TaxID=1278244 RepID=A0A4Q0YTG9_9GAMM|nr:ABC transporter ATP-binding protein [Veronia nyctiphanis]RXJ74572.1 ABC transporter ATP-binding protein [Veronia nyctiphanis]